MGSARSGCSQSKSAESDLGGNPVNFVQTSACLQNFLFGEEQLEPALYYAARSRVGVPLGALPSDAEGLRVPPQAELSFNSLLNAFFERHWFEHTTVRRIACVIDTSGDATLTVHRGGHHAYPIASRVVSGSRIRTTFNIDFDPPTIRHLGYLYLTITDVGSDFRLHTGTWETPEPPKRLVELDIVFCAFNKVPFVRRNLQALASTRDTIPEIRHILVVDQGTDSVSAAIAHDPQLDGLRRSGALSVFTQPNLGGSGGFTRGIMEALASGRTSHVLLLDDDIVLEPRILGRLIALIAHARDNPIVGGHMLDLYRPAQAAACAETFDFENGGCQRLPPFDFDCREPENLARICEIARPTYNAWWFCCLPREVLERRGLPLPFFIRTDDAEFGVRATFAGENLIQMPGIFVWHKPFYAKQIAWMSYYSLRNDLILCNIAAPEARRLGKRYRYHFWNAIKAFRYDEALATCLAIEDYLLGPETVFEDAPARHRTLLERLAPLTARKLDPAEGRTVELAPPEKLFLRLPGFLKDALCLYWSFIHGLAGDEEFSPGSAKVVHQEHLSWPWTYGERGVIVHNPHEDEYLLYRRDTRMAWRLARRFLRAMGAWRRNDACLRKAYADAASVYTTWESWERLLDRQIPRADRKDAA